MEYQDKIDLIAAILASGASEETGAGTVTLLKKFREIRQELMDKGFDLEAPAPQLGGRLRTIPDHLVDDDQPQY